MSMLLLLVKWSTVLAGAGWCMIAFGAASRIGRRKRWALNVTVVLVAIVFYIRELLLFMVLTG